MSLKITWTEGPVYPALVKGVAVGVIDGRLMVAGGMSYPWREVDYGFWLSTEDTPEEAPSAVVPGEKIESPIGTWHPMPPMPQGPGWTSGAAVAGGLAVVGGRRRAVGNSAIADCWFLDVESGATVWEKLPDRPSPAMVPTTMADGDNLYTAFGTDWHPHEHATGDPNIYRMNVRERGGWEVVTEFPGDPRWMGCMAICNGKLWIVGGRDLPLDGVKDRKPYNAYSSADTNALVTFRELWSYDFEGGTWEEHEHPPRAFVSDGFTVDDRWIVLPGGNTSVVYPEGVSLRIEKYVQRLGFTSYSYEVWAYDTKTSEWSCLDPLPYGTCSHRVSTWGNHAYLVGNETMDEKRSNTFGTLFIGEFDTSED